MMCVRRLPIATQRRKSLTSRLRAQTSLQLRRIQRPFQLGSLPMPSAFKSVVEAFHLGVAGIALSVAAFSSSALAYESASGPRVRGLGVVSAPVDRRGPTLRPDPMMMPDSGFLGSGSGGVVSSGRASGLPSIVPPPPQPVAVVTPVVRKTTPGTAKKARKSRGRIILQKPNG